MSRYDLLRAVIALLMGLMFLAAGTRIAMSLSNLAAINIGSVLIAFIIDQILLRIVICLILTTAAYISLSANQ